MRVRMSMRTPLKVLVLSLATTTLFGWTNAFAAIKKPAALWPPRSR
jgi:hypothetical protein